MSNEKSNHPARLYSAGQITAATVIGAPIAGAILLTRNYNSLGNRDAGRKALLWGSISTVVLLVASYFLPEPWGRGLPMGYSVGMYHLTKQLQGERIEAHLAQGGPKGSTWVVVGVGVLSLLVIFAVLVGVAMTLGGGT